MDIKYRNIDQIRPSLLFSVLAATTTELITYPLESVKVRLQMNNTQGIPKYKGIIDCARSIKLYRGITAGLANHVPFVCLKLWIYEISKQIFTGNVDETTYPRKVSHIAFAGCLALGFVNPAEILKIRMINTKQGEPLSLLQGEGYIKNLWKGYHLNAFNLAICFSISLAITNKIKRYCKLSLDIKNENYHQLIAASVGGLLGACVTSPVDVLKTRYMNDVSGQSLNTLFKEVFLQLQIYKGFSVYALRMVSTMIIFQVSENVYKNMM